MSTKRVPNLIGQRFGRWTVISRAPNKGTRAVWHCRCDCGVEHDVRGDALRRGASLSCGCLAMEHSVEAHRKHNEYIYHDNCVELKTVKGESIFIDKEDVDIVKSSYWYLDDKGYARSLRNGKRLRLHNLLMMNSDDKVIDHKSGKPTDNRKCNLRFCTVQENAVNCALRKDNTSGYKGVYMRIYNNGTVVYRAVITYKYKKINLGTFYTIEEAIDARKKAELKYFGEYSRDYGAKVPEISK